MLFHIYKLLCTGYNIQRGIVIPAIPQYHQAAVDSFQDQVQCKISIGHGHNGIDGIRISSPYQISQVLIDDIDWSSIVEFCRFLL